MQELTTLLGHRGPITCVKFHPVYNWLVTSSEDTTIKIWDYESGTLEKTLKGHTKTVHQIAIDQQGLHLGIVHILLCFYSKL